MDGAIALFDEIENGPQNNLKKIPGGLQTGSLFLWVPHRSVSASGTCGAYGAPAWLRPFEGTALRRV